MTNDVPENPEGTIPCIALSKNDSYVMSACGGKVSLFNMMTFKVSSLSILFYPVLRQLRFFFLPVMPQQYIFGNGSIFVTNNWSVSNM